MTAIAIMVKLQKIRRIAETVACMEFTRRSLFGLGFAMSGNGAPREIWVDQDGGWEDVAAIAILLRSPDIRVLGISTTPGIAEPKTAQARVRQLLAALHERDAKLADAVPAGADILATGPLTAVARLIRNGKKPSAITWMGGAIQVAGNAKGSAEWNAAADAEALATVLASGIPLTVCPLDLTNQFPSTAAHIAAGGAAVTMQIRSAYAEKGRFYWDELAAASLAAPALFKRREMLLNSDRNGRLLVASSGHKVIVLQHCDPAGFQALLARSLRF
jgi:inosine-uridine nucleoside N-ribohydrolase